MTGMGLAKWMLAVGCSLIALSAGASWLVNERNVVGKTPAIALEPSIDEGWPTLFGPRHDCISRETGIVTAWPATGPQVRWRTTVGAGYSSPVAMGDLVYVLHRIGDEEVVEAFDIESGQPRWRHIYPTAYACRFAYSHGPYSTPTIDGEYVYTYGAEGVLHCLDRETGKEIWSRSLNREYEVPEGLFGASCSPLVEGGRLIINIGAEDRGAGIVALDKRTGKTVWTAVEDGAGYATARAATIYGRRHIFSLTDEFLVSLDPADGKVHWQIPFKSKSPDACNATSPLVVDDLVLVTTGPGYGSLCLRILPDGSFAEIWRDRKVLDSTWNNLVHADGYVYGFSSKRLRASLRCIELATGKLMWNQESDLERGAMLAVGGRLLILGEQGHLGVVELRPDRASVVSITEQPLLERPCYSAPALHRGLLFLRNEGNLVCYDLRAKIQ